MPRVIHFEIHASNVEGLISFYSQLFGWSFQQWGENPYWMVVTGPSETPGINGGLLLRRSGPPVEGAPVNAFVCTIDVSSVDASLELAVNLGGTVAVPKMPIPGMGWLGYIKDPDGNILGMMQIDPQAA